MERYHAFPGTGDGDDVKALDAHRANVFAYAACEGLDPQSLTVMRKDTTGQLGTWVKFDDALKRSRKEYAEGFKAAKDAAAYELFEQTAAGYDRGREDGLKQGRKDGQIKVDAISEISAAQFAEEYTRGHTAGISSKLAELVDSHKAENTYSGELAEAEEQIDRIVALLREYQDVKVTGRRGLELAAKLTAFVNENGG